MKAFDAILTRRSIRKYKDGKIPDEKIADLLKAAMYAPSAFNLQPWEFFVADDKNLFEEIIKSVPYAEMIRSASHIIVVCGDNEKEKNLEFLMQDCSAAIQNILVAAHAENIGSCWIASSGISDTVSSLKKILKLPENIIPVAIISLGYPAETPDAENRFSTDKVHINKW